MRGERAVTGCALGDGGQVVPCHEVSVRLIDATCAIRVGERGLAQQLRREAAQIVRLHLRVEALDHDGCGT